MASKAVISFSNRDFMAVTDTQIVDDSAVIAYFLWKGKPDPVTFATGV